MSDLLKASLAGLRSSVFVSPGTLNTTASIFSSISGRDKNHLASAQFFITSLANLFVLQRVATSLK